MDIILYSTGCPKCKVLEKKLNDSNINYTFADSLEDLIELGYTQVPILKVNDEFLDFTTAINWINTL